MHYSAAYLDIEIVCRAELFAKCIPLIGESVDLRVEVPLLATQAGQQSIGEKAGTQHYAHGQRQEDRSQ
ncbi:Uncharacterised protein [Mycobacterium tuberculosis]|nr:Uncharacterised protein [Mycobacterium tuberculosis]COW46594.1 Uncharacterised protein [Mycobacterium tuberculosis]COW62829.1 Uncharacterised protein [Mycobacterium tuberculosis]